MKKILPFLFTSLIVLLMLVGPGNPVQAAQNVVYLGEVPNFVHPPGCGCEDLKPLTGPERNKIVSDLLKTDVFKDARKDLMSQGITWNGAGTVEVIKVDNTPVLVGIPFTKDGKINFYAFAFLGN
jgi:hypothetical protein